MTRSFQAVLLTAVGLGALSASGGIAHAQFKQTNLVSDIPGLATLTDSNLINTWGVSAIPGATPFWISNQGTGTSSLFSVAGSTGVAPADFFPNPPGPNTNFVAVPPGPGLGVGPTGQVANPVGTSFRYSRRTSCLHFRQSGRLNFCLEYVEHKQRRAKRRDCRSVDPGRRLHRIGHQQRGQLALRRQWSGKRVHRRLQRLIRSDRRPRRICRSDPALRIRPLQCRGHRRQGLRDLCASGARGPDKRDRGHGLGGRFR